MRFWVDIANSPHAPLFEPVVVELRSASHEVLFTAWDRAQTRDLALTAWPEAIVVGEGADPRIGAKALRIARRARALREVVAPWGPDVALGHNSYAQLVAARRMHLPAITLMDYEHQPANHLAFRLAGAVLVPEAFPARCARRQGAARKLIRYPGFKEEITLARFQPDPDFRRTMSVAHGDVLVTCRPPPEGALYHRKRNDLFEAAVQRAVDAGARVLLSPRDGAQASHYAAMAGVEVLERAVGGADLLHASDLVLGAGGTMTREAAILGTPSYTLFAGRPPAVDTALIATGRMTRIDTVDHLASIAFVPKPATDWVPPSQAAVRLAGLITSSASRLLDGRMQSSHRAE